MLKLLFPLLTLLVFMVGWSVINHWPDIVAIPAVEEKTFKQSCIDDGGAYLFQGSGMMEDGTLYLMTERCSLPNGLKKLKEPTLDSSYTTTTPTISPVFFFQSATTSKEHLSIEIKKRKSERAIAQDRRATFHRFYWCGSPASGLCSRWDLNCVSSN